MPQVMGVQRAYRLSVWNAQGGYRKLPALPVVMTIRIEIKKIEKQAKLKRYLS